MSTKSRAEELAERLGTHNEDCEMSGSYARCVTEAAAELRRLAAECEALRADAGRLDWLQTQGGITLERLRTSAKPDAVIYWNLEDRDGEYLNADGEPEDMQSLRDAIDAAMKASHD